MTLHSDAPDGARALPLAGIRLLATDAVVAGAQALPGAALAGTLTSHLR